MIFRKFGQFPIDIGLALQVGPYTPLHDSVTNFRPLLNKKNSESNKNISTIFQTRVAIFYKRKENINQTNIGASRWKCMNGSAIDENLKRYFLINIL